MSEEHIWKLLQKSWAGLSSIYRESLVEKMWSSDNGQIVHFDESKGF